MTRLTDSTGAGKGDGYRTVDAKRYAANFDHIFRKRPKRAARARKKGRRR